MITERANDYKVGKATLHSTDYFKSETEKDLHDSVQNLIAKLICTNESNEVTTYYTI
jgi:hypothetical protein